MWEGYHLPPTPDSLPALARSVNGYYTGKIKGFTMVHKCVNFRPPRPHREECAWLLSDCQCCQKPLKLLITDRSPYFLIYNEGSCEIEKKYLNQDEEGTVCSSYFFLINP